MRFGCRVFIGALLLIGAVGIITQAQDFPIIIYSAPSPDSITDPGGVYTTMNNFGATHLIGEATVSMVSLATIKGMKVIKTGAIIIGINRNNRRSTSWVDRFFPKDPVAVVFKNNYPTTRSDSEVFVTVAIQIS